MQQLDKINRRKLLAISAAGASIGFPGLGVLGLGVAGQPAFANIAEVESKTAEFLQGNKPVTGQLMLEIPELAEDGNGVAVSVRLASPMSDEDHVKTIILFGDGNPWPQVAAFHFTPLSGEAMVATRIRLARSQNVIALASTSRGEYHIAKRAVRVTIGGCGANE